MSSVRHFDVPHLVRFGRLDDETRQTWMRFYRAATCFEVTIHGTDIQGSPFEAKWSRAAFKKEDDRHFSGKWNDLCDCVIEQILPNLQQLAPAGLRSWTTLEDYIRTTSYKLSLHKTENGHDDIEVRLDEGPTTKPAFEIHPELISALPFDLPNALPRIPASDLQVLDQHKDLPRRPYMVRLPDASIAYLISSQGEVQHMPSGRLSNPSLDTIQAQLNLYNLFTNPEIPDEHLKRIPKPLGIVTTSSEPIHPSEANAGSPTPNLQLAGILLTDIPGALHLSHPTTISLITSMPNPTSIRHSLHESLRQTIATLHAQKQPIIHGNINPHTILIANREVGLDPLLVGFSPGVANNLFIDQSVAGTAEADLDGLESTFGENGWLAHEIGKAEGLLSDDQPWEKSVRR